MSKPIVFYHYPCADGFTAAWAVWKKHPDWEFYPAKYGELPPDVTGRDVYMVDFSYKQPVLIEMAKVAERITILDHHKTAKDDLVTLSLPNVWIYFDMDRSGARLAWEFFHPDTELPKLVRYVEDRDLWKFQYSATRPISAYIFAHPYDFQTWDDLASHIENYEDNCILQGQAIELKHHKDIDELSVNKFRANIGGYNVPVINVPYTLASDMCHKLAHNEPFAASFYYDGQREKFIFSLRSADTGVDVSAIAKQMGGGGHPHAAGFEVPASPLKLGLGVGI